MSGVHVFVLTVDNAWKLYKLDYEVRCQMYFTNIKTLLLNVYLIECLDQSRSESFTQGNQV